MAKLMDCWIPVDRLLEILNSDKAFEEFLMDLGNSPEFKAKQAEVENGNQHLNESDIDGYLNDTLDEPTTGWVMDHMTFCRRCSSRIQTARN